MTRPHRATEWLGRLGVPSLRDERPFEGIPFLGFSLRSLGLSLPSFPSFPLFGSGIAALPACATEVRRPVFSGLRPLVSAGRARRCFSRNSALWYWPGSAKSGSAKSQLTCPSISEAAESNMRCAGAVSLQSYVLRHEIARNSKTPRKFVVAHTTHL